MLRIVLDTIRRLFQSAVIKKGAGATALVVTVKSINKDRYFKSAEVNLHDRCDKITCEVIICENVCFLSSGSTTLQVLITNLCSTKIQNVLQQRNNKLFRQT